MKKLFLLLAAVTLIIGCSSSDEGSSSVGGECSPVTNLEIVQNSNELTVTVTGSGALYYEISILPLGYDDPNSGSIVPLNSSTETIDIFEAVIETGDYQVFARVSCEEGKKGKWFGPKLLTIEEYCGLPKNLGVNTFDGFYWESPDSYNSATVSNYQIEYGLQGFEHGQGTIATVNINHYSDIVLQGGQNYDFYVRAYCSNNVGYGNWVGPYNYYAETNLNMCTPPSNIITNLQYNNGSTAGVSFQFSRNGEDTFEYTIVHRNQDISEGTIHTLYWTDGWPGYTGLNVYYDWDFYIRAVCNNGNRTVWVKKEFNP